MLLSFAKKRIHLVCGPLGLGFSFIPLQASFCKPLRQNSVLMQEYREYSSCEGTQAIPCLVSLVSGSESLSSSAVLSALMYTGNQASVFHHLVEALSDTELQHPAGTT